MACMAKRRVHGAFKTDFYMKNWPVVLDNKAQEAIISIANKTPKERPAQPIQTAPAPKQLHWQDRRLGSQSQDVAAEVGDFILKRADGCFAYQLAVVVDDAAEGITDVVRGEDLSDNTAVKSCCNTPCTCPPRATCTPRWCWEPTVKNSANKTGAQAMDTATPQAARQALGQAAQRLGLNTSSASSIPQALQDWTAQWGQRFP